LSAGVAQKKNQKVSRAKAWPTWLLLLGVLMIFSNTLLCTQHINQTCELRRHGTKVKKLGTYSPALMRVGLIAVDYFFDFPRFLFPLDLSRSGVVLFSNLSRIITCPKETFGRKLATPATVRQFLASGLTC
jgi:hypothetical protein